MMQTLKHTTKRWLRRDGEKEIKAQTLLNSLAVATYFACRKVLVNEKRPLRDEKRKSSNSLLLQTFLLLSTKEWVL